MNFLNRNAVKWGLVMTALTGSYTLVMHLLGFYDNREEVANLYDLLFIFIVPLVVWYLGLTEFKRENKDKLPFKTGLLQGFKISVVYGVLSPFVYLKYYLFLNPGLVDFMREEYGLVGAPASQVYMTDMLVQLISALVGGTIYSILILLFIRTKK